MSQINQTITNNHNNSNSTLKQLSLYKCDGRLTEMDLQKYLNEFIKFEKIGKLTPISGANLTLETQITTSATYLPSKNIFFYYNFNFLVRISSSLLPLRPWRCADDTPLTPAFELQTFVTETLTAKPYKNFTNLLYVYPISINYGGQKAFSKARNIACSVRFVGSIQRNAENIKVFFVF